MMGKRTYRKLTAAAVWCPQGEFISMGVYAGGNPYGIPEDLIYSFPVEIQVSRFLSKRFRSFSRRICWFMFMEGNEKWDCSLGKLASVSTCRENYKNLYDRTQVNYPEDCAAEGGGVFVCLPKKPSVLLPFVWRTNWAKTKKTQVRFTEMWWWRNSEVNLIGRVIWWCHWRWNTHQAVASVV